MVVMICDDPADAEGAGRSFLNVNRCVLVRYQRPECMMRSMPAGPVAAAIVDLRDPPAVIGRTVEWLRRRWPRCPIAVVGDVGGGELEMAARCGGASYLTRPVTDEQWSGLLPRVLADRRSISEQRQNEGGAEAARTSGTVAR
ncbi:MAG TPA: hypothetical protein VM098_09065 [Phycisphaerae bacterium]|nr:hypothetical protein [Phycisphaerae bacterium]